MSGKLKKLMAIIAALGITSSGVIAFLQHLQVAFPGNHKLGQVCAVLSTLIGLAVAYFPVSIKAPDDSGKLQPPVQK